MFLGSLLKISILVFSFITESAEKKTIYGLSFLIAIYSPQNDSKHPSEMKNYKRRCLFTISEAFPGLGPILTTGLKC